MGTLDAVQQEQLRAIGTYLNQVRQEQSRSLEEIAAKTYIPLRLLKAIELGQEQPLPEPVFVQGFIRRYADSLGLDGMELAQKFPVQVTPLPTVAAPSAAPSAEARSREARSRAAEPGYLSSTGEQVSRPAQSPRSTASYLPYLAAAALLALGGIGLAVVRSISSRPPSQPDSGLVLPKQPSPPRSATSLPSAPSTPVLPSSSSVAIAPSISPARPSLLASPRSSSPSPSSSPSSSPSPSPSTSATSAPTNTSTNAPVSVEMQLTDRAWVQVTVDGVVKAEAVLPKGTRQSWSGRQQITVVSGNAGAVSVAANGDTAKVMGAPGAVTELTVKPK